MKYKLEADNLSALLNKISIITDDVQAKVAESKRKVETEAGATTCIMGNSLVVEIADSDLNKVTAILEQHTEDVKAILQRNGVTIEP